VSTQTACGDVTCQLQDVQTADITEGWREVLSRTYGVAFDARPAPAFGEKFAAQASRWPLGTLALVRTTHGPGAGRRGPAEIRASSHDVVGMLRMRSGTIGLEFDGQKATLRPGELVLWDGARRGGFVATGAVDNQTLVIPRAHMRAAAPHYEAMIGRPFRADHPAARLMGSFLESLSPVVGSLDPTARGAVADASMDLARAMLSPRTEPLQAPGGLLTAVRLYIDAHLGDPALSPASIAKANAISVRTLHRLFENADDSVGAVIREGRLSRCHAELLHGTDESVTAIAFRWGFRNMSFFSRLFRERYGVCAREVQMAARASPF
jgi:AraC family transcriptional regulator, positive regulator of tynA and feaB